MFSQNWEKSQVHLEEKNYSIVAWGILIFMAIPLILGMLVVCPYILVTTCTKGKEKKTWNYSAREIIVLTALSLHPYYEFVG